MLDIKASARQIQALKSRLVDSERVGDFRVYLKAQALLLYFELQMSIEVIGMNINRSIETVRLWIQQFTADGVKSLKLTIRSGRQPKLSKGQFRELYDIISSPPSQQGFVGGCWNSAMIQALIFELYGVEYAVKYIPQLMKRIGLSYQKAKFDLNNSDTEARKKWIEKTWPAIKSLASKKQASILFEDEASFAMWGSLAYTWAPRGQQPTVKTSGNRKSYKVFGAIEYGTGKLHYKGQMGKLNAETYLSFLKQILRSKRGHIIIVHDGAPYHRAKTVKEFIRSRKERLAVRQLPAYSPDFNPIERLWRKAKRDGTHLNYFPTFDSLVQKVEETMKNFLQKSDEIFSLFYPYRKQKPCY